MVVVGDGASMVAYGGVLVFFHGGLLARKHREPSIILNICG